MILLRRIQDLSDCVRQIPIKAFFQLVFWRLKIMVIKSKDRQIFWALIGCPRRRSAWSAFHAEKVPAEVILDSFDNPHGGLTFDCKWLGRIETVISGGWQEAL